MEMNEPGHMLKCLRSIHAAFDADGADLSAWPAVAADEIERIADELMVRERDARRYRWLRDNPTWVGYDSDFRADELDAAIDAAMLYALRGLLTSGTAGGD